MTKAEYYSWGKFVSSILFRFRSYTNGIRHLDISRALKENIGTFYWPRKDLNILLLTRHSLSACCCLPYYTVSQLNWYPFCFANEFVNSENNSNKFHRSLEWSIVKISWKFNRVLLAGSKVMLVQIWTSKFWTFQHVKDTLLTKNDDVIYVAKYQFLWIFWELFCGSQVDLLDSIRVLQHKHFP